MNPSRFHLNNIHFIGIGGSGMSGIAEVLLNLGYKVSGSDKNRSNITDRLAKLGADINYEHDASNLEGVEMVVISSAIDKTNPEVLEAKNKFLPILARAEMLSSLMNTKRGIAVAGTHGKTTTTSIISSIMTEAGLDPTFINGGIINSFDSNAQLGKGKYLIAEADESDKSFLLLQPSMAVVTNIEPDHLINYENSFENQKEAFLGFIKKLPFNGMAVVCGDDPVIRSLIPKFSRPFITYGFDSSNDFVLKDYNSEGFSSEFTLNFQSEEIKINFNMLGKHNALNAAAATVICMQEGVLVSDIQSSLKTFKGINRRMQVLGEVKIGKSLCTFIDDYGHHPTEIFSTIKSIKESFPKKKLCMVFQPHRYTRTKDLFKEFIEVLAKVDNLILLDVYSAGEEPIQGINSVEIKNKLLGNGFNSISLCNEPNGIIEILGNFLDKDSIVIMQGAGDISEISSEIMNQCAIET